VIEESHVEWTKLISKNIKAPEFQTLCTALEKSVAPDVISKEKAEEIIIEEFRKVLHAKN